MAAARRMIVPIGALLLGVVGGAAGGWHFSRRAAADRAPQAVTSATPKWAAVAPPPGETYTVLGKLDGISGYAVKYDNGHIRGGQPVGAAAVETLKGRNVKTIVSITPDDTERKIAKEGGMELVELPFGQDTVPNELLRSFHELLKTRKGPFYVHCHGGSHRGGVLMLFIRLHVEKWPLEKALVEFGRLGGDLKADHSKIEAIRTYQPSP